MSRSCAAAVLTCNTRSRSTSDSAGKTATVDAASVDPRRRAKPTRRPALSVRRRRSDNKENISGDENRHSGTVMNSRGIRKPEIRFPRLFPDLAEDKELERSSLVRTSSALSPQRRTTSTNVNLEDVSAISRTSDIDGQVLHRVRSTTSMSSLNGAFCSSSGDEATTAAGAAFCSTFSYPLHSTVIDSFFDVSALLPPRPLSSPAAADDRCGHSSRRPNDINTDRSSLYSRCQGSEAQDREGSRLLPRLLADVDKPSLFGDTPPLCQIADVADSVRRRSTAVDQLSPSSATEMDFARSTDANCTARLRRQMGQTRLYSTNSSSSQRQSDLTCSRLNVDDDFSRSTLFECGCGAEQRLERLPEFGVLPPSAKNFSLVRSAGRHAEQFESPACFTDTCCSWSSDGRRVTLNNRRMTLHCPPPTRSDALFTVDRPTDIDRDGRRRVVDDRRHTGCRQSGSPFRRPERRHRGARERAVGGGCPLCGCGRAPANDAADCRRTKMASKLASNNCDDTAAERRRKRELLRKLRRFSDALYGNTGALQLKTFGHF